MDRAFHRHSGEQKTKPFHLRKIGKRIHHLISHSDGNDDDDVKEYIEEESDNIILSSESQFKVATSVMDQQNGEGGAKPPKPQSGLYLQTPTQYSILLIN